MASKKTFHSAQGELLHPVRGDDIIVLAQSDTTALEGYRTVSASLADFATGVTNKIKNDGIDGIINIAPFSGIIGDGTIAAPMAVDAKEFNKNWVVGAYTYISQVGNQSVAILPIIKDTGYNIRISSDISVFLAGLNLTLPAQTINLANHITNPESKTILMYLTVVDSALKILLTTQFRSERFDSTYVGTIVTGVGVVNTITAKPFMRVGNYRLSEVPQGAAIPVTANSPAVTEYPSWGGTGTLKPINAGIDTTKWTGNTTFNKSTQTVRVVQDGQFYIKDLKLAIDFLGSYFQVYASGGVKGAQGYLNGVEIWKGKGNTSNVVNRNGLLREGWNTVHMEWGELQIRGPFLK